ncbi:MAG: hypothetical protein ACR2NB_04680 [Solirubrobacteraceae bacterium]
MPITDLSFVAHHSERPAGFASLSGALRGALPTSRIGASIRIPRGRLAYNLGLIGELDPNADYILADPESRQVVLPYAKRGRGRPDHDYLKEDTPAANRARYVEQVLRSQIAHGADTLITPSLIHGLSPGNADLDATVDFANAAIADPLSSGRDLVMGLEALHTVFANTAARNYMINSVVELDGELPVWLRMTITASQGRSQFLQETSLKGLRVVVESLTANSRPVLLPHSGLCGWLMMGFGALAFGAGVPGSLERNVVPSPTAGGGGNPPLHWYFEPQLLGFVRAEEMPGISGTPGFAPCPCPFCGSGLPATGAAFDPGAAARHYLWWCVTLVDDVRAASDRPAHVRGRLDDAVRFWGAVQTAGVLLDDRSKPGHLAVWQRVAI